LEFDKLGDSLNNNIIIGIQGVSYKNHEQYGRGLSTTGSTKLIENPLNIRSLKAKVESLQNW